MEGNTMILAGGLMSLAIQGGLACKKRKNKTKDVHKQKLSSLIISKGCGKTQLKKSLQSLSSNLVIIDMNEAVSGRDELEILENGRAYVDNLLVKFPKKKFLLLLSTKGESEYFGVSDTNSFAVCPSIKLFKKLLGDIEGSTPDGALKISEMERAMMSLVSSVDKDLLNIYDSFSELYQVIKTVYKLQSTF